MRKSIRYLAALFALLICIPLVACANDPSDDPETTTTNDLNTGGQSGEDGPGVDDEGYLLDNLPDNLDFNSDVNILYWNDARRVEFDAEKENGDIINDAVSTRNSRIIERLGVNLQWHGIPGDNTSKDNFVQTVQNQFTAGNKDYDLVATYSRTAGMLAVGGYFADLNDIDDSYLDFDMPWWPDNMIESFTVGDAIYFITGDAATSLLHYMTAIFYNKDLFDNYGIPYLSEDVFNNTWTFDRIIEITSNTYQDLDNDGKQSDGDFYGFTSIYYNCDAFYTGSLLRLVEPDEINLLKISNDFFSERAVNLVSKLGAWLTTESCYISKSGNACNYTTPFVQGSALMCQLRAFMIDPQSSTSLTDVDWTFGIVPNPKYDTNQDRYMTIIGNPFTIFGILNNLSDKEKSMCTAVLECWGSEAYRRTTPAIFEVSMKIKYSATETESIMYDIIRESLDFDLGRIFGANLSNMSELPSKAMTTGISWATMNKAYTRSLSTLLKNISDAFIKQQG